MSLVGTWQNWARCESATPARVVQPRDAAEVAEAVTAAVRDGLTVKAIGAGHSFTGIAAAPGVQLDMSRLQGVASIDAAQRRVKFRAGTRLYQVPPMIAGLAFENLGDIDVQSICGATSTGTGAAFGGLATQIAALTLITAEGKPLEISASQNAHLFQAARLGLGALGIITDVTVQCVPSYQLHAVDATIETTRKLLDRHGFHLDDRSRIKPQTEFSTIASRVPQSLGSLRDPSVILDSFARIDRALPTDPAQAIGSAKELIEATAKTVLLELGVPFDDKIAKLPALIDLAQRGLHVHPQSGTPGPDGSNAVKRILGGLTNIAIGLGELRNEGWGTDHAPASPRTGLHPRHALLAVGAAHAWCQLILDTLADPAAPWRSSTTSPATPPRTT